MKVVVQKIDLDTCLTGLILGIKDSDEVIVTQKEEEKYIYDPSFTCIESGGSGLIEFNNFDHHDQSIQLPPACRQAYESKNLQDETMERLMDYVCMVDERLKDHPIIPFPSLSNIFSGMLILEKELKTQFFQGIKILNRVLNDAIDPFSTMPDIADWQPYRKAKEAAFQRIEESLKEAKFYTAENGDKVGFMKSTEIGGSGTLYRAGCDIVVACNPSFGEPPVVKFTISGNTKKVVHLLTHFDKIEKGWGGRETIIGSPRTGSHLTEKVVLEIVLKHL